MVRYAIVIGVEEFEYFPTTRFAHADARLLRDTLVDYCDYLPQHVSLLTLAPNADRSPEDLLYEIEKAASGSGDGDTVLFYYAGHGHLEGSEPFLLLPRSNIADLDRTALPLRDVSARLRRSGRMCVRLLDACHSGVDVRSGQPIAQSGAFLAAIDQGFDADGWITLAACGPNEKAYPDGQLEHGIFTYYLCEYVRKLNANDEVVPELLKVEIVKRVSQHAKKAGYTQTPSLVASVRGNISMANRRVPAAAPTQTLVTFENRIRAIDATAQFSNERLTSILSVLTEATKNELVARCEFAQDVKVGDPFRAWQSEEGMRQALVEFAQSEGYRSRHTLKRVEREEDDPFVEIYTPFMRRRRKVVDFVVSQDSALPDSMVVINVSAQGLCVPAMDVLVYIIPLQVRACLLISGFHMGWAPESRHHLMKHCYALIDAGHTDDRVRDHAKFAVGKLMPELRGTVIARVAALENEIKK